MKNEYHTWSRDEKFHYTYPSMKVYHFLKADTLSRIEQNKRLLTDQDRGEEALRNIQEWVECGMRLLATLDQRKAEGYFASEEQCSNGDSWFDSRSWHEDKGIEYFERADRQRELKAYALKHADCTPDIVRRIDEETDKQTRFGYAHFKKAGGINWRERARIKELMIIQGRNNDNNNTAMGEGSPSES